MSYGIKEIALCVVAEPIVDPVGRGRVVLEKDCIPLNADDGPQIHTCGRCKTPLMIGYDRIRFH